MNTEPRENPAPGRAPPSFRAACRFWLKLGFISFGGPAGQIALMQTELVEKRKWISAARFLHALNFCMLLPGPEAQQLAIYTGWLLHRTRGGLVAGTLFVLPSMFVLWGLSFVYAAGGDVPWIAAVFYGLKPAVMAIVAFAVFRLGKKALKNPAMWSLAGLAFVSIFFFHVPFPILVFSAGLIGFVGGKFWPERFRAATDQTVSADEENLRDLPANPAPSWARAVRVLAIGLLLWWTPILFIGLWLGWTHTLFQEGLFFSKAALVTFGGAYAVLPYVAQQAVEQYGWLHAGQMMDGLGLAETTPGPLIMVLQFVGFVGAWQHPGALAPLTAATLGALLTTWVTFVPCFLWIFLGAPHVEQLRHNRPLTAALSAVTAAVVGVVLNLAVWFVWHVLFPANQALDLFALVLGVIALLGLWKWQWDVIPIVLASGLAGLFYKVFF